MTFSISGKTAIVTGAANGVGLAIARHFLAQGANVMFADMDEEKLAAEIGADADKDGPVRYFAGDLRHKLTIANLMSATVDAYGRIDILVNASRQIVLSDPLCVGADGVEDMLEQNLLTSLRVSQMVAKRMIAEAGRSTPDQEASTTPIGSIINLSSIAARLTQPELLGYSISCAALDQMTRSLAVALAPSRIRVNAVSFGSVMSASLKGALKDHPGYRGAILDHTPLGRIASPTELAQTVQYLASEGSNFMTGQILTIDGGRTLLDPVAAPVH